MREPRRPLRILVALVGALWAGGSLSASSQLSATSSAPAAPEGPSLRKEVLTTGLVDPWDLAFLPDGNLLYTERPGRIGIYSPSMGTHKTIQGPPEGFYDDGLLGGMLGIAVDPDFATNRYVYTYMTSRSDAPGPPPHEVKDAMIRAGSREVISKGGHFVPTDQGRLADIRAGRAPEDTIIIREFIDAATVKLTRAPTVTADDATLSIGSTLDNRVVRWVLAKGNSFLKRDSDIVTGIPYGHGNGGHQGGRIRFGPDGYLWIATGDADIWANPQSGQSLGGKILRVNRDGNAAPGNNAPPGFNPRIYTYGHRNPQGLAFRPGDGAAFATEHGPDFDDEVNRLVPATNYGWDPQGLENPNQAPMTDLREFPACQEGCLELGHANVSSVGCHIHFQQGGRGLEELERCSGSRYAQGPEARHHVSRSRRCCLRYKFSACRPRLADAQCD